MNTISRARTLTLLLIPFLAVASSVQTTAGMPLPGTGGAPSQVVMAATGQVDPLREQVALLVQQVSDLQQRVGGLQEQVRLMERSQQEQNRILENQRQFLRDMQANVVTMGELQTQIQAARTEIGRDQQRRIDQLTSQVNQQIQQLTTRTNEALEQMARTLGSRPGGRTGSTGGRAPQAYPQTGVTHTVASGENLTRIANRYGAQINHIRDANNITDDRSLQVGQVLFIPLQESQ